MISVIVTTRNDDHGRDMLARNRAFIRCLSTQAEKYQLAMELVVVEWNPPDWTRPMAEMLACEGSDYFQGRVYTVPSHIHQQFANHEVLTLYQMIGKNVGIRRAKGEWILCTNPDLLFSDRLVEAMGTVEDNGYLYRSIRKDMPFRLPIGESVSQWLENCEKLEVDGHDGLWHGLHTYACGDFQMMRSDDWSRLRGYPQLHLWSIHIDSLFAVQAVSHGYKERLLSGNTYHLHHERSWVANPELANKLPHVDLREVDAMYKFICHAGVAPLLFNDESWGLGDVELEVTELC